MSISMIRLLCLSYRVVPSTVEPVYSWQLPCEGSSLCVDGYHANCSV